MMLTRSEKQWHILSLLLLVTVAFAAALAGGFVWDDPVYLLQIDAYRHYAWRQILFGLGNGLEYQPVRDLTYLLDGAVWGWSAMGFHLTNLILYLLNVGAVYLLADELTAMLQGAGPGGGETANRLAFWTAAIFAVHPLHVEPVAFITGGRNTLLAALFSFLATWAFCRFLRNAERNWRWLAMAAGWFVLAILSKATATTLPLFFAVLALVVARRRPLATRTLATLPLLLLGGLSVAGHATIAAQAGLVDPLGTHVPLLVRGAIAVQIPFFYLGKLLVPTSLAVDYASAVAADPRAPKVFFACFGLMLVMGGMAVVRRRAPHLFVATAWYGATLVPVLYLLPSPMIVADRYAFLPSFGFCFALAWLGSRLVRRWRQLVTVIGLVLLCCGAVLSFRQTRVWHSGQTLWEQVLKVRPDSTRAMDNLGTNLFVAGAHQRALNLFAQAKALDPRSTTFDFFSGLLAYTRRDLPTAASFFRAALERQPDQMDALFYLGSMSEETGQYEAAAECFRRVLSSRDLDRGSYRQQAMEHLQRLAEKPQ